MRTQLPAALTQGPFTAREAYAAGLSARALRGPAVRRVFRGVYLSADVELTEVQRTAAALKALPPGSVATGVTALWMFSVEVGDPALLRFCGPAAAVVDRTGIRYSRVRELPPKHGRWLVSPEHAFLTASADLDLVELTVAGDWLVRLRRTTPDDLVRYVDTARGRGVCGARRAAALVRRGVDSPPETRLRLCLVLAGLPEPLVNQGTEVGQRVLHPDLRFLVYRVLLEYEGDQHRTDRRQWSIDIGRAEEFQAEGFEVIRVTADRMRRPRILVLRVFEALRARGYDGPEPEFTPEWRRLFERPGS